METLARACLERQLPGSPGIETKRVGQRTAVYGTETPKIPPVRGGGIDTRITPGWAIHRSFTPIPQ